MSASDETDVLMVIYNEIHKWDADVDYKNRSSEEESQKRDKIAKLI